MPKTYAERFAAALLATGETEVAGRSLKYRTFTRREGGFYFIGRSGALRFGPAATKSRPVSDQLKRRLLDMKV